MTIKRLLKRKLGKREKKLIASDNETDKNPDLLLKEKETLPQIKIIKRYPKEKCFVDGCDRYAVGKGDTCRKHGGEIVIKENLIKESEMTSMMLRTTLYDPSYHPIEFIRLSKGGLSIVEIASEWEVASSTLKSWSEKYSDFNTAYDIGISMHEAWWLGEGKKNLDNRGYNVGMFKFLTGNKLGYSDKIESKNLTVHAGVLQVPGQPSLDEWEEANVSSPTKKD